MSVFTQDLLCVEEKEVKDPLVLRMANKENVTSTYSSLSKVSQALFLPFTIARRWVGGVVPPVPGGKGVQSSSKSGMPIAKGWVTVLP